jgi:hypothetical protein
VGALGLLSVALAALVLAAPLAASPGQNTSRIVHVASLAAIPGGCSIGPRTPVLSAGNIKATAISHCTTAVLQRIEACLEEYIPVIGFLIDICHPQPLITAYSRTNIVTENCVISSVVNRFALYAGVTVLVNGVYYYGSVFPSPIAKLPCK